MSTDLEPGIKRARYALDVLIHEMRSCSEQEREALIAHFSKEYCIHCGREQGERDWSRCQCTNDE